MNILRTDIAKNIISHLILKINLTYQHLKHQDLSPNLHDQLAYALSDSPLQQTNESYGHQEHRRGWVG